MLNDLPIEGIDTAEILSAKGWPWHGVFMCHIDYSPPPQAGFGTIVPGFTAAPDSTKTYPEQNTVHVPRLNGHTWLIESPHAVDAIYSEEDIAAGKEWPKYAIISNGVLYGKKTLLNSFFYKENGNLWLVEVDVDGVPIFESTRPRLTITCSLFGVVGAQDTPTYTTTMDLDLGDTLTEIEAYLWFWWHAMDEEINQQWWWHLHDGFYRTLVLLDALPDQGKCLFGFQSLARRYHENIFRDTPQRYEHSRLISIIEVVVTGGLGSGIDISVEVLKDSDQVGWDALGDQNGHASDDGWNRTKLITAWYEGASVHYVYEGHIRTNSTFDEGHTSSYFMHVNGQPLMTYAQTYTVADGDTSVSLSIPLMGVVINGDSSACPAPPQLSEADFTGGPSNGMSGFDYGIPATYSWQIGPKPGYSQDPLPPAVHQRVRGYLESGYTLAACGFLCTAVLLTNNLWGVFISQASGTKLFVYHKNDLLETIDFSGKNPPFVSLNPKTLEVAYSFDHIVGWI